MRKQLLPVVVVPVVAAALVAVACRRADDAARAVAPPPLTVVVEPVQVRAVQRTVAVVGTLRGDEHVALAAQVAGRIAAVEHDLGDRVGGGTVLARIDAGDHELAVAMREAALRSALAALGVDALPDGELDLRRVPAVERARIEAENADARSRRADAMFAEQPPLITEEEHADVRAAMASARAAHDAAVADARAQAAAAAMRAAELAMARRDLADTAITTPPGGPWRVARRRVAVGDYVMVGTPLFDVVDVDPIEFHADVPERWAAAVRAGQRVELHVPSRDAALVGEVVRLAPVADDRKRTFAVEIRVPNADGVLLPGGFARGAIATGVDDGVVFVPQDAVVTALGTSKVFTVAGGVAVEHKVAVGSHDGAWVEITRGELAPGDRVVTSGAARLAHGVDVDVAPAQPEPR